MPNVIESLKAFRRKIGRVEISPPERIDVNAILNMTADQFSKDDIAILIRSYLLGEDILLVSNPTCMPKFEGEYVTYLPEELEALHNLSPDFIKRVHKLKKLSCGEIMNERSLPNVSNVG